MDGNKLKFRPLTLKTLKKMVLELECIHPNDIEMKLSDIIDRIKYDNKRFYYLDNPDLNFDQKEGEE